MGILGWLWSAFLEATKAAHPWAVTFALVVVPLALLLIAVTLARDEIRAAARWFWSLERAKGVVIGVLGLLLFDAFIGTRRQAARAEELSQKIVQHLMQKEQQEEAQKRPPADGR